MGSSVGVSKVHGEHELGDALSLASSYDEWIVVEEAIVGREVECAVLGNELPAVSGFGEIVPSHEFYDYDDKYSGEGAELIVPTDLPADVVARGQELAVAAFTALRCEGMARVDFFYDGGGLGLVLNEVNTIPGFTPYSMYPQLWQAAGVPYAELIDRLITLAVERHARRSSRLTRGRPA
jgi:D-alanine-D-alanine ligase